MKKIILISSAVFMAIIIAILILFSCNIFGHKYNSGDEIIKATCGAPGKIVYTCERCEKTKTETIPSTDEHSWEEWEIEKKPTYDEMGKRKRICKVCGEYDAEQIEKSTIPDDSYKDQEILNINGKAIYKVYCIDGTIRFEGSFNGSGNFIIKVLDSNQDFEELVCNEIGTYFVNKSVNVGTGWHYIEIICSNGSWDLVWYGTVGD